MSVVIVTDVRGQHVAPVDDARGTVGMFLFIATEATLFALLFFSYYFLAMNDREWPRGAPPHLGVCRRKVGDGQQPAH